MSSQLAFSRMRDLDRIRREATGNTGADGDGSSQFSYQQSLVEGTGCYETLLLDSMRGDERYLRPRQVEAEWRNHYAD